MEQISKWAIPKFHRPTLFLTLWLLKSTGRCRCRPCGGEQYSIWSCYPATSGNVSDAAKIWAQNLVSTMLLLQIGRMTANISKIRMVYTILYPWRYWDDFPNIHSTFYSSNDTTVFLKHENKCLLMLLNQLILFSQVIYYLFSIYSNNRKNIPE